MEAIGAGANVIAFITLALVTAKNTHNVLVAVKDGPKNVKDTADAVLQLTNVLDQITKSSAALSDQSLLDDARRSIERLAVYGDKLMELQVTPHELIYGRFWKRLRCFLNEKDLDSMRTSIVLDYTRLNTRLSSFTSTTALQIRDNIIQVRQSSAQTNATLQQMQTNFEAVGQRLASVESSIQARESSSISSPEAATIRDMLSAIMESLQVRDGNDSASRSGVLGEIDDTQSSDAESSALPGSNSSGIQDMRGSLEASLDRLGRLVSEKERTHQTFDEVPRDCSSIIEDLSSVLITIGDEIEALGSQSSLCTPCKSSIKSIDRGLKGFNKRFATDTLVVNAENVARFKRRRNLAATVTHTNEDGSSTIKLNSGLLTFRRKCATLECSCAAADCEVCALRDESANKVSTCVEYETAVTFIASNSQQHIMLNATNTIRRLQTGYSQFISHLAINRILPYGSRGFELVKQGLLHEFREGLQRGEFTLRDHDEFGASLLCDILEMSRRAISHGGVTLQDILNHRTYWGESILDVCCSNAGGGTTASNISAILKLGFDVNSTNGHGWTSLQALLGQVGYRGGDQPWQIREQDAIVMMLQLQADPSIIAYPSNATSFDIAYFYCANFPHCLSPFEPGSWTTDLGSYRGDLWDSCLSIVGYKFEELAKFRQKYQRRAIYTDKYTRELFESFWQGREHLCPYWDDEPWPLPQPSEGCNEEDMEVRDENWICPWCLGY